MEESFLKKYFWDNDFKNLNLEKHKSYVIERILEFGDEKAGRWVLNRYSRADIIKVLEKSRKISPRSRAFWQLYLAK